MQLIITDAWLARSRAIHLSGTKLVVALALACVALVALSIAVYHGIFLAGARQGWPVIAPVARVLFRGEVEAREVLLQENISAMARKLGQMQARLSQLESLGERVAGMVGLTLQNSAPDNAGGGPLLRGRDLSLDQLSQALTSTEVDAAAKVDWLTAIESRLSDQRIRNNMVPTQEPVEGVAIGSRFGWRIDPLTGRQAFHSGLDFPAWVGTPILAAAGGVVVTAETHPAYGRMVEIEHANGSISRYAHASSLLVKVGDLVRRGQEIARVGTTGRSTGPHLHFEVLVDGVQQNPQVFLDAGRSVKVAHAQ